MSQTNEQGTQPSQQKTGRGNDRIMFLTAIAILLAACVYLFVTKNNIISEREVAYKTSQTRIDSVQNSRESLQNDFNAASVKIDQLVSQNVKKDSALQSEKNAIAKLQGQIRRILNDKNATAAELKQAREMINSLTDKTTQYEERIAMLEKENTELTGRNQVLVKEVDSVVTQTMAIKKVASVLHTSNVRLEPIHQRRNGKEKETTKARKADMLRVVFDIDENRIAESGNKQMYIRILDPNGKVLSNSASGPGVVTASDGTPINYSVMKEVPLTQNEIVKNVSVDLNREGDFSKGNYTVEIYNEGYKVGSANVSMVKSWL